VPIFSSNCPPFSYLHHDSYKNVMAQEMDCGQGASSPLTLIMHNRRAGNMYFSTVLVERTRRAGNNETI
jgi:hypothetical protein